MSTLYVIDSPGQRDLILKGGAPHDEHAPVLARVIDWPWMAPSSPWGRRQAVGAGVRGL